MTKIFSWIQVNSIMLINAGSLIGTTVVTSGLGFAYWWVAARWFPPEAVGVGSASISAMMLLGSFCILGMGTLLITELPRRPEQAGSLLTTALLVVGMVGLVIGMLFAFIAARFSVQFQALAATNTDVLAFGSGVSLTSITLVLDQALIGLLRGSWQLWRNALFAIAKLILLFVVSVWFAQRMAVSISLTWTGANAISLLALYLYFVITSKSFGRKCLPRWSLLLNLGGAAFQHHLLNLTLAFPALALPVLVTWLLSARINAWFYVAWMLASFVFLIPTSLTTVLHAMNAAQQSTLAQKARSTIMLSCVLSTLAISFLQFTAPILLTAFGGSYALQAATTLRVLVLAAFALTIKNHYISICRIQDRIRRALLSMIPGGLLELGAAVIGANYYGLEGLSVGWVLAVYIEALCMLPTVYAAVWSSQASKELYDGDEREASGMWVLDTISLPVALPHSSYGINAYASVKIILPDYQTSPLGKVRPRYLPFRHARSPNVSKPPRRYSFVPDTRFRLAHFSRGRE
ncbi:MAG: lipopolysaccharide biosynthesis protein [Ktedonobacteraceae bacterium]|nr:lipopolysaccharide biosynthesis protein [Ktedonobacteraceae bacterium]